MAGRGGERGGVCKVCASRQRLQMRPATRGHAARSPGTVAHQPRLSAASRSAECCSCKTLFKVVWVFFLSLEMHGDVLM